MAPERGRFWGKEPRGIVVGVVIIKFDDGGILGVLPGARFGCWVGTMVSRDSGCEMVGLDGGLWSWVSASRGVPVGCGIGCGF